jgi:hypothetical protein
MSSRKKTVPAYSRQFSLTVVGPSRTNDEVRQQVQGALHEALESCGEQGKLTPQAEPKGTFIGTGTEWTWVFAAIPYAKTAVGIMAGAALKKAGEKLFETFITKLPPKNLLTKVSPEPHTPTKPPKRPASKSASHWPGKKKGTKKRSPPRKR